jgi:PPM family protein phosphatase
MHTLAEVVSFGKSDIGNSRGNNEDAFAILPDYGFFALADGMGGHNAGEIAAHETISFLCRSVEELVLGMDSPMSVQMLKKDLQDMLKQCNKYVHHIASQNITLAGMGTTLCVALIYGDTLIHAHIGDSRIYLYRNETLFLLTRDHSLINKVVDEKKISHKEARSTVSRSAITRSIGKQPTVVPEVEAIELEIGDLLLLCSDGLTDVVEESEITPVLQNASSLEDKTNELIQIAKSKGGSDNITIITVRNGNISR